MMIVSCLSAQMTQSDDENNAKGESQLLHTSQRMETVDCEESVLWLVVSFAGKVSSWKILQTSQKATPSIVEQSFQL